MKRRAIGVSIAGMLIGAACGGVTESGPPPGTSTPKASATASHSTPLPVGSGAAHPPDWKPVTCGDVVTWIPPYAVSECCGPPGGSKKVCLQGYCEGYECGSCPNPDGIYCSYTVQFCKPEAECAAILMDHGKFNSTYPRRMESVCDGKQCNGWCELSPEGKEICSCFGKIGGCGTGDELINFCCQNSKKCFSSVITSAEKLCAKGYDTY